MRSSNVSVFFSFWIVLASLSQEMGAQSAPPVPPEYQDLYHELYADLTAFQNTIRASRQPALDSIRPVASASLSTASSSLGSELLTPNHLTSTMNNLDGLKALGVKAITVDISFPTLYRGFYQTDAEYQQYVDYYVRVAQEIRARGMILIVDSQALLSWGGISNPDIGPFYASLTLEQYRRGRMEVCRTIAQNLRPDYLLVVQEPDTEASQTGFTDLGTISGSTALLKIILNGLQSSGVQGVQIGAGIGTWMKDYLSWVQSYAFTSIDFIDMHIYPVNRDFLTRALQIADTAKSYGKGVAITETWLQKIRDSELGVLPYDTVSARYAFSFWAPLDALHLQVIADLASYKGLVFITPFWTDYFRAYVDYSSDNANLPMAEMLDLARGFQSAASAAGTYTSTGIAYLKRIRQPDTAAPLMPSDLSAQPTSSSSIWLTWTAAPDNIGTAGYLVSRNGTQLTQTSTTQYVESGLSDGHTYTYSVAAFDATGNVSPAATVSATTPDTTAPSVPTHVMAKAELSGAQILITVSWSPSVDNMGVSKYKVYRGTSPDTLSQIGSTASLSYSLSNVPSETTYYFAVAATDARGNSSGLSAPAGVTTPQVPDITPPAVNIGYPKAGTVISRSTYLYATAYDTRSGVYETRSGVAGVQFRIDGINVGPEQTVPFTSTPEYSTYRLQFDTTTLPVGTHVVTVVARDKAGNRASSTGVAFIVSR